MQIDQAVIRVHREWNGCRTAEVRLDDLQHVHWFQPPGAPRPLVHGYVSCTSIVNGDIPHECTRTDAPHRLLVCVLKKHTIPAVHMELVRRADSQRMLRPNGGARPLAATQ